MSEFICKTCNALLGVGNVYCLNCGTPVVASVDDGPETVLRTVKPRAASNTASIAVGLAILIGGGAFMLYTAIPERERATPPKSEPGAIATGFTASPTPTPKATQAPTAAPTRERSAVPTPTVESIDEMRARIDRELTERERRQLQWNMANAANVAANARRNSYRPDRPPANVPANRYVPTANANRPRSTRSKAAVCADGTTEARAWDDAWRLCLEHGGPVRWIN